MSYTVAQFDVLESRIVTFVSADNQIGINTFWWSVTNITGASVTLQQLAADHEGLVFAAYKAWMANNASFHGVGFTKILPGTRTVEENSTTHAGPGTAGANMLAQQTSGVVTKTSALAGRHFRGRFFPPFPATASADANGNMNGGGFTLLQAVAAACPITRVTTVGGNTATLVQMLRNRVSGALTPVVQHNAKQQFGTQRRRGQFGRSNIAPF